MTAYKSDAWILWRRINICNHSQGSFVTLNKINTSLSVVGIVTKLWAEGLRVRIPARQKNRFFTKTSRQALGLTRPRIQWVPRVLSSEIKRPGRETDHTPSSAEAMNKRSHISVQLYAFKACTGTVPFPYYADSQTNYVKWRYPSD